VDGKQTFSFLWFVCERLQRSSTFGKFMFVFLVFFRLYACLPHNLFFNEKIMRQAGGRDQRRQTYARHNALKASPEGSLCLAVNGVPVLSSPSPAMYLRT